MRGFGRRLPNEKQHQTAVCECFDGVFGLLKNADCAKGGLERFGVGPEGPNKDSKKVAGFPLGPSYASEVIRGLFFVTCDTPKKGWGSNVILVNPKPVLIAKVDCHSTVPECHSLRGESATTGGERV